MKSNTQLKSISNQSINQSINQINTYLCCDFRQLYSAESKQNHGSRKNVKPFLQESLYVFFKREKPEMDVFGEKINTDFEGKLDNF